jgi:hypothetical protein
MLYSLPYDAGGLDAVLHCDDVKNVGAAGMGRYPHYSSVLHGHLEFQKEAAVKSPRRGISEGFWWTWSNEPLCREADSLGEVSMPVCKY